MNMYMYNVCEIRRTIWLRTPLPVQTSALGRAGATESGYENLLCTRAGFRKDSLNLMFSASVSCCVPLATTPLLPYTCTGAELILAMQMGFQT